MTPLSRRALLGSTASLGILPGAAWAMAYARPVDLVIGHGPPVAPVRPVSEIYYGHRVTDPYRWMESMDAAWRRYVRAQGAYAEAILDRIPGRDALRRAIAARTGVLAALRGLQVAGELIFTELRPAGAEISKLYVRHRLDAPARLLIDPAWFAHGRAHQALDWWRVSPDGAHVVFGCSASGSEQSTLRVVAVASGKLLPIAIDRTTNAAPSWLPDGSGFFYNRLQDVPPQSLHYEEKSLCWLHRLGTDPALDRKMFGQGVQAGIAVRDIEFPFIVTAPDSKIAIAILAAGVRNELTLYVAPLADVLAGRPGWARICDAADAVTNVALTGDDIYLLTHKHAPRYRVVKVSAARPDFTDAVEVVPQSAVVIRNIVAARNGLYIQELAAGLGRIRHLALGGGLATIALPFAGAVAQLDADPRQDGAWVALEGWVRPLALYRLKADGAMALTDLAPQPPIDLSPYQAQERIALARDGTRVPVSVISRKALKHDGTAPLLLEAYGAYGITLDPVFLARWLPFLDQGGVFAVAHVRGGGELGEDWHKAGQKAEKFHSWQDAQDCALHLIDAFYTSHRRLAVMGGSAGGITVGRLMTERPALAAVIIDMVGVSNTVRSEFSPNGPPNIPEFGSVKTRQGFLDLYAMDAYQHVHEGVKYPSVLLTTGLHDPRVPPWEPAKMAARLQAATAARNPVLLRVQADAGHGIGATRAQQDDQTADIMAFILWRTGDPRFQPVLSGGERKALASP